MYVFSHRPDSGDVLVLGALEPLRREQLPRWEALPAPVREDLERVRNYSTADLWSLVRLLPDDVDRIVGDAPVVNSDENLAVELASPWQVHAESLLVQANWALFAPFTQGVLPLLVAIGEPLDAEKLGALALAYADQRGDAAVAATLARAAESRGSSARGMAARVLLAGQGQTTAEALGRLDAAVTLAPGAAEPRFLRGALRFAAGRDADALEDAAAVVALTPDDPRPRALRWRILQRLGRLAEAEADLDAIAISPLMETEPDLWQPAAELYIARGRIDDGTEWLRRVLEGRPTWVEGWELLAVSYERIGHRDEAARARRNAGLARRNGVMLLERDARLAAWRRDWKQARELLEQAAREDPAYFPVHQDLERVRAAERDRR